jgi:hypothetical protein
VLIPDPWIIANPRVAHNGGLVRCSVFTDAFDAVCALRGVSDDDDERQAFENSPDGVTLGTELQAAMLAALEGFAQDPVVRNGGLTLEEFLEYLKHE